MTVTVDSKVRKPIYHRNCWECPECHTINSLPSRVLLSMPPQTPYYCTGCDYKYHYIPDYSPEFPIGSKHLSSAPKVKEEEE